MKSNIILIGMPGSGKSTIGVQLAKWLGYDFIDADLIIQKATGKTLADILTVHGDSGFIKIENEINQTIDPERSVIATGGSAVYGEEAMKHFKEIGDIVYFKVNLSDLEERLGDLLKRGVVSNGKEEIGEILKERTHLYEKYAEITMDLGNMTPSEAAAVVFEQFKDRKGK